MINKAFPVSQIIPQVLPQLFSQYHRGMRATTNSSGVEFFSPYINSLNLPYSGYPPVTNSVFHWSMLFFQKLDHILCCFKHLQHLNVRSYQTVFYSPPTPEKKAVNLWVVENIQALIAGENLSASSFTETKYKSVSCVNWYLLCCRWYWSCVLRDWPLYWQGFMGSRRDLCSYRRS